MRGTTLRAALAVVALTGFLHGLWTERWGSANVRTLAEAAARVERVPLQLGRWEGESAEMSERERRIANVSGSARRWYWNREVGAEGPRVWVSLVCGRPQDIGAHTPDVCYTGAGFRLLGETRRRTVALPAPCRGANFWVADFRAPVQGGQVRVWWAWSTGEAWEAPDLPRWTYARSRVLYKVTVMEARSPGWEKSGDERGCEFLCDLLPKMQRVLTEDDRTVNWETFLTGYSPHPPGSP